MNAIAGGAARSNPLANGLRFIWNCWRSTTVRQWLTHAGFGVFVALVGLLTSLEFLYYAERKDSFWSVMAIVLLNPFVVPFLALLAWSVADRVDDTTMARPGRLALALVITAVVHAAIMPLLLYDVLQLPDPCTLDDCTKPGWPTRPRALRHFGSVGLVIVFGGLMFAMIELLRRQAQLDSALEAAREERGRLARNTFESRLAAMQAQVEPQFLFDSLVDIEALYERDVVAGGGTLDRLIAYLRTALPRLRDAGSTVQAEVELVAAYLAVVSARHAGKPAAQLVVAPDLGAARFYPMLLLPLVQRAMRAAEAAGGTVPERIELVVARRPNQTLAAVMRIAAPGLCEEDAELARVRERLAGLYGNDATLECTEPQPGLTQFILSTPIGDRPRSALSPTISNRF